MKNRLRKRWKKFHKKIHSLISELKSELSGSSSLTLGPETEMIIEELIFRKIPFELTEDDYLKNEQIKHRINVLKTFLDFEFLGVKVNQKTQKLMSSAATGCLNRTRKNQ